MIKSDFYQTYESQARKTAREARCPPRRGTTSCRDYFLRSATASLALASDSACLPPSCSFWASSSFATAALTFGSSAFILAAASRPSLMTLGQELAIATPPVNATVTATAIATIACFIGMSPLLRARLYGQPNGASAD